MVAMARGITRKMCASTTRHIMRDKRAAYDIKHLHEAGAFTSTTHDNASELESRVSQGRYRPWLPSDPDVRNSRIRLFVAQSHW
jgi:hypothetical protein